MSRKIIGWHETEEVTWNDITGFIDMACTVLNTIEPIDFGLMENGVNLKKEIQKEAIAIICKGMNSILLLDELINSKQQ